jgi:3-hydroxypropanoate dehydrogenase
LGQLFSAHACDKFFDRPVEDEVVRRLHELIKWGPAAVNCQPGRVVFVKSPQAESRLTPCLPPATWSGRKS